ncbi:MAG: beta-hydroxyacyl-ACP dehydratase [Bacteroidetes bacterium]|nr:MAG: beta-hydroxyacyl-ACP dehydratase [Bacteroidota bacterium]
MTTTDILRLLPYTDPFLFVEELAKVDQDGTVGYYTFSPESYFYRGHFRDHPVTPGVILTETMAQIGLVCLGIYLLREELAAGGQVGVAFSSQVVDFLLPVYPGERVKVVSEKVYFRFGKLKCRVKLLNTQGELACKGELAGMCQRRLTNKLTP